MKPIRIVIAGYYGYGNTGDEAILTSMLNGIRGGLPESQVTVLSYDPEWTSRTYSVNSVSCREVDSIHRGIQAADGVLIGGGGLFHDYWGIDADRFLTSGHSGIVYYAGVGLLSALYKKPLILYAAGVGPLLSEEGRLFTGALFSLSTLNSVRDAYSREVLDSIGLNTSQVQVVADPAVGISPPEQPRVSEILLREGISGKRPLLGISLRNWNIGVSPGHWEKEVAGALDRFLREREGQAVFIPFQTIEGMLENDRTAVKRVMGAMEMSSAAHVLKGTYSPGEIAGIVGDCDLLIGMRFHSVLFGVLGQVPVVAIGYDPKVGCLMKDLGCEASLIDMEKIRSDRVKEALDSALDQGREIGARFRETSAAMRTRHEAFMKKVCRLLDSERPSSNTSAGGLSFLLEHLFHGQIRVQDALNERDRTDGEREQLRHELDIAHSQLEQTNDALQRIRDSRTWKLGQTVGKRLYGRKFGRVLEKLTDTYLRYAAKKE